MFEELHPLAAALEATASQADCRQIAAALGLRGQGELANCPVMGQRNGAGGCLQINQTGFRCMAPACTKSHLCEKEGDALDLVSLVYGIPRDDAVSVVFRVKAGLKLVVPAPQPPITTRRRTRSHGKRVRRHTEPSYVGNTLTLYLREIDRSPLLSSVEEKELGAAIQYSYELGSLLREGRIGFAELEPAEHSAQRARDRLTISNLRLVVRIARRYQYRGLPLDDLIAEGNTGLMHAVERYDPGMETRFSTYASWWIKQAMRRALLQQGRFFDIPAYLVPLISRAKEYIRNCSERNQWPTPRDIARELGISERRACTVVLTIQLFGRPPVSLSEPICQAHYPPSYYDEDNDDPENYTIQDMSELLISHTDANSEDRCNDHITPQQAQSLLEHLDEREATILRLRFGLDELWPMTLKDIGFNIGLTRERVRQLERDALLKLRKLLQGEEEQ